MWLEIGMDPMLKLLREFINQTGFAVYNEHCVVHYTQKNKYQVATKGNLLFDELPYTFDAQIITFTDKMCSVCNSY